MTKKQIIVITIIIGITLIVYFRFSYSKVSLDEKEKKILTYQELPINVANKFKSTISNRVHGIGKPEIIINLDRYLISYEKKTIDNDFSGTLLRGGAYYYFTINGYQFSLRANLGDPFVFNDTCVYFPNEFEAVKQQYLTVTYTKICFCEDLE